VTDVQVTVNGVMTEVGDDATLGDLVRSCVDTPRHVAAARNGAVVPRGVWDATCLRPGDSVEVLAPAAGG
jgi:sulfur carrier protein